MKGHAYWFDFCYCNALVTHNLGGATDCTHQPHHGNIFPANNQKPRDFVRVKAMAVAEAGNAMRRGCNRKEQSKPYNLSTQRSSIMFANCGRKNENAERKGVPKPSHLIKRAKIAKNFAAITQIQHDILVQVLE